jgi:hypothetical protein
LAFSQHFQKLGWRSYWNAELCRSHEILLVVCDDHCPALNRYFQNTLIIRVSPLETADAALQNGKVERLKVSIAD